MYKKRYLAVIAGGLAFAAFAFAQTGTTQTPGQDARTQTQTQRQELKTQLDVQRKALRAAVEAERTKFRTEAQQKLQSIRTATPEERETIRVELKAEREELQKSTKMMRDDLKASSTQLREDFRTKVQDVRERAKIAAAHGRGLKMINRYRAAIARFDHLIGRLEMRLEKLETRGIDVSSVVPMIEEAKNMKVEADADLEAMKAKYEDLLNGENTGGVAEEARAIAKDLKTKLEAFHNKLKDIAKAIRALVPEEGTATTTSANTQ
ncbi:MAG: hypothetical protein HYT22_01650 [Candidatus Niyogibacteria bacterium]|nr:hypothetical protein [Candidatus Niyogibacteria bacterium]